MVEPVSQDGRPMKSGARGPQQVPMSREMSIQISSGEGSSGHPHPRVPAWVNDRAGEQCAEKKFEERVQTLITQMQRQRNLRARQNLVAVFQPLLYCCEETPRQDHDNSQERKHLPGRLLTVSEAKSITRAGNMEARMLLEE